MSVFPKESSTIYETSQLKDTRQYVIDIYKLTKGFTKTSLHQGTYKTLKTLLVKTFKKKSISHSSTYNDVLHQKDLNALKDVTIRILPGASIGIIGKNGSGKSTLLKLISGIYKADEGYIHVNGRIAALIELGAGFHPDFTGRENLFLGGIIHGLSKKDIQDRFQKIVKFAELEHVIDEPVRTYSSGMFMRLGFSLAIHTDPDLLIIDEVLAVGDAAFVNKCKEKIHTLKREGKTILLVSHDLDAVERFCDEVVWLDKGIVKDRGEPRRVIDHYRIFIEKGEEEQRKYNAESSGENAVKKRVLSQDVEPQKTDSHNSTSVQRWGSREIEIHSCRMKDREGNSKFVYHPEEPLTIEFCYTVHDKSFVTEDQSIVFGIAIHREDGILVHGTNTHIEKISCNLQNQKNGVVRYMITTLHLIDNVYSIDIAVHHKDGYPYDYHKNIVQFSVRSLIHDVGIVRLKHEWDISKS
jgi:ABC-type polysaccharide/polyol phosphate transport system ATPase subunit